jgi:Fanconi-associated nuclease 1
MDWRGLRAVCIFHPPHVPTGLIVVGHVLTRLVCKGAHALGILGEYEYELRVLESLLAQKRWRRGRRGRWHERRALILERYALRDADALSACLDALKDDDTHIGELRSRS